MSSRVGEPLTLTASLVSIVILMVPPVLTLPLATDDSTFVTEGAVVSILSTPVGFLTAPVSTALFKAPLLLADRTRDARTITTVVTEVLAANPETTPLDIETALRAAAGQAYLVANSSTAGFEIVLGMPAWHAALAEAGVTVEQNWAALSTRK